MPSIGMYSYRRWIFRNEEACLRAHGVYMSQSWRWSDNTSMNTIISDSGKFYKENKRESFNAKWLGE